MPESYDTESSFTNAKASILEQSAVIWHSSLTEDNKNDLERVQKNAFRNILKQEYTDYETAQKKLNLESLHARREKLMVNFGRKCLKLEQTKDLFPRHSSAHNMNLRQQKKYCETECKTERLRKSTVPYLQRLLNKP